LYELNKEKNVSHFAVIDASGVIGAHNDNTLWNTPVESSVLLEHLQRQEQTAVLDSSTYHTLVPVFGDQGGYLVTVDIGFPKSIVDEKVQRFILQSGVLFSVFLVLTFFNVWYNRFCLFSVGVARYALALWHTRR